MRNDRNAVLSNRQQVAVPIYETGHVSQLKCRNPRVSMHDLPQSDLRKYLNVKVI